MVCDVRPAICESHGILEQWSVGVMEHFDFRFWNAALYERTKTIDNIPAVSHLLP